MACFAAPAALGVFAFAFRKSFPERWHIGWLNTMILGATVALGIDHAASGEIVPYPPFLSAMANPADAAAMAGEIISVGIPMAIGLVLAWVLMVVIHEKLLAALPSASRQESY
ncbi:hypothetical protein L0Y65_04890 [Candidatus Micrarchaeota archaeon]|nr:hypothetical protein [Candidatus Micrarchaeota archaeon]